MTQKTEYRPTLDALSNGERSLLLYLESRAVDYDGRMSRDHMNTDDDAILERWVEAGFVVHGRIIAADANINGCEWVRLSSRAMSLAQEERRARAARLWKNRGYMTTAEKRGDPVPEPNQEA